MGLLSFLGPAVDVAAHVAGAYETAQSQTAKERTQQAIQILQLQRQQKEQAIKDALMQAQTGYYGARANALENPRDHFAPMQNTFDQNGNPIGAVMDTTTGKVTPTGYAGKPLAQSKEPTPHYSAQVITAADGSQHLARFNTLTGQVEDTGTAAKPPSTKNATKTPQALQAIAALPSVMSADSTLDKLGPALPGHWGNNPITNWVSGMVHPDLQQANQASNTFATLVVPTLTRRGLTAGGIQQVIQTYTPVRGDTPQTIAQKSQMRKALIQALREEGGAGASTPVGGSVPTQGGGLFDDITR